MRITVYTKPSCVQCTATYRALDAAGFEYEVVYLFQEDTFQEDTATPPIMCLLIEAGVDLTAPVVIVSSSNPVEYTWWNGFRPDKIDDLKARVLAAA